MADIRIDLNLPLQQNLPADPYVRTSSKSSGFFNSIGRTCKKPFEWARFKISPWKDPTDTLRRIDEAADRGLRQAKTRDVPLDPLALRLHGAIDLRLGIQANAERIAAINAAQVGEVADIHPLLPDEEVTRAPLLQDRPNAPGYWKNKIEEYQRELAENLSIFTTLLQMRDRCGCAKKDENNLAIMALVKRATAEGNPPSVWTLFTERYDLTFFQTIQAAWFYCIYYLTSLINNTVNAYLDRFIENMTKDLVKKNSETRTLLFRMLLQNTNQFLIADIQASKDFANAKGHGDREDYQDRAIERHYGFSLSELCRKFSEKRVEEDSPQVRFFRDFQKIPILKWGFKAFEWLVNRFIIQRSMKSWILPNALESTLNKGFEATYTYPFFLSMTRFFRQRLVELETKLEDKSKSSPTPGHFPGTEALPETIKYLKLALALEEPRTPLELRRKFEEIEADKGWGSWLLSLFPTKIDQAIEESIVKSGDLLFRYLNETAESGELFALALERSLDPFRAEVWDPALLEAEYKKEKSKLLKTAEAVFKKLVDQGVSQAINGTDAKDSWQMANDSFDDQREIARISVAELSAICTRMAQKVEASREAPTPENNVQTDIASIFQAIQVIAQRQEFQEELNHMNEIDQNAIRRVFNPFLEKMEKLQKRVLKLQELQDHYPSHVAVGTHLQEMKDLLRSIRDQFHAQPRHLQHPLIQSLGKTADDITRCLGAKAPLYTKLQGYIGDISKLSESIVNEQQVIDAIQQRLYPPRNGPDEDGPEGLLDQMLNYQRGLHPQGFSPRACLAEIGKCLAHFPAEERVELERIIGNGSNLRSKWPELGEAMQRIYTRHLQNKNRDKALLDDTLDEATAWIQEKRVKYNTVKGKDHNEMQAEMTAISAEVETLKSDVARMQLNLSSSPSQPVMEVVSRALPLASGYLAGGGPVWALLGGIAGKLWHGQRGTNDSDLRAIAIKAALIGTGIGASYLGWVPATLAYGYAGWGTLQVGLSSVELYTNNKVWKLFNNAYKFILHPRVPKAATTRAMVAMSE